MKIQNIDALEYLQQLVANGGAQAQVANKAEFEEVLNLALKSSPKKLVGTQDVERFKQNLSELGTAGYISTLNSQKIEDKLAQKREELTELLGLNDPNKSATEINELTKVLEKMLQDYRKELNIALNSSTLLEKQQQLSNAKNTTNLASVLAEFGY